MLSRLSIRDVVLIKSLDLDLSLGLTTMTGETGAGKSILLDALGLAIGERAESRLVRQGASMADVTAVFDVPLGHPSQTVMLENQLPVEDDCIIMRRTLNRDGKSKAYVNGTPVTAGLLRQIGHRLIEIQGQFDQHGLMNPATHIDILDIFANTQAIKAQVSTAHKNWQEAKHALDKAINSSEQAQAQEQVLQENLEELNALEPKLGEAKALEQQRNMVANTERTARAIHESYDAITNENGMEALLLRAIRTLEHSKACAGGVLDDAYEALERALIEIQEALHALDTAGTTMENHSISLEAVDDRLFALRDAARKHGITPDDLPSLMDEMNASLAMMQGSQQFITQLQQAVDDSLGTYLKLSKTLSACRHSSAYLLCDAMNNELPHLRLDGAVFSVDIQPLPPYTYTPNGQDNVTFMVQMNAGASPSPLHKSASGGELSRLLLALKVCLAETSTEKTIVFDEIDHGVGGATAHAIGERLCQLGERFQVMTITHSPQVAAKGETHMKITKSTADDTTETHVNTLNETERREELARMLSGNEITAEARAAAKRLMS